MNKLIAALLDCPNLSLKILDAHSRQTITTIDREQLARLTGGDKPACSRNCNNRECAAQTNHT